MAAPVAPVLERPRLVEDYDRQASPLVSWVIDVELPRPMHRDRFMPLLQASFRLENDVAVHAFCPDTAEWTYPETAAVPERYTRLQLGVALVGRDGPRGRAELEAVLADVRTRLAGAGITTVTTRPSIEEAEERSALLDELVADLEEALVGAVVEAPDGAPFAWQDVRRVLGAMGLAEGEREDGFAWLNARDAPGDDVLFTVVPEVAPGDAATALRFGLHPARTADPVAILEQLFRAAEHAHAALGGRLLGLEGEPFDPAAARAWLERTVARLRAAGLEPGAYHTMTVF